MKLHSVIFWAFENELFLWTCALFCQKLKVTTEVSKVNGETNFGNHRTWYFRGSFRKLIKTAWKEKGEKGKKSCNSVKKTCNWRSACGKVSTLFWSPFKGEISSSPELLKTAEAAFSRGTDSWKTHSPFRDFILIQQFDLVVRLKISGETWMDFELSPVPKTRVSFF